MAVSQFLYHCYDDFAADPLAGALQWGCFTNDAGCGNCRLYGFYSARSYCIGEFFCLLVFLAAVFISGMTYGISLILPNEVVYETAMNAIVLSLFFLSTALFPAGSIDGFLGVIVNVKPLSSLFGAGNERTTLCCSVKMEISRRG